MAKNLIEFMDDALKTQILLDEFTAKINQLYDAQGRPLVTDPDQELSDWFDQKGYNIPRGQCKKLEAPISSARGKIVPKY